MGYKKYTDEFREQVAKEYINGERLSELVVKHNVHKSQIMRWAKKWKEHSSFPDDRGKKSTGRPRLTKINKEEMTDKEYIAYLEMQLEIKKYLAFYEKRKQK